MDAKKSGSAFITKYLKDQDHSSEEDKEVESFVDDFEPFMVKFRRYRTDISETERQSQLARGLIILRQNPHMPYIRSKRFDPATTSDVVHGSEV